MFIKETLPNGIRIVTEELKHVRSVSVGIWIGAGSRDESTSNNGIAHFIEHMLFKGTKNRTAKQIAEELDAVGGQLNAFTAKEYTCLYAKTLDEHFDVAVDILSDMFFNSVFDAEEIEKEKNVVIEEINMYEDAPDELIHDYFVSTIWGDHPLGRPVIGTKEVVADVTRQDILDFIQSNYRPNQIVIAVAGNVTHQKVVEKISPIFAVMSGAKADRVCTEPVASPQVVNRKKDTEQVHLCLGMPGLHLDHADMYVMHVMNGILGGGLSSRLFQHIREEKGLAYSVYSYHSAYKDAGLFSVYTGLTAKNLEQVLSLITYELNELKQGKLTDAEVTRAQAQLKGSLFLGLESASNRMSRLGKLELSLGKIITAEEAAEKINQVTLDDVRKLADKLFQADKAVVATIGPVNEKVVFSL